MLLKNYKILQVYHKHQNFLINVEHNLYINLLNKENQYILLIKVKNLNMKQKHFLNQCYLKRKLIFLYQMKLLDYIHKKIKK